LGDKIENDMSGACSEYGEEVNIYRVLMGKSEGRNHSGDPGVGGRIILRWIIRKWDVGFGLDQTGSG
jgi:hypothetical protein